MPSRKRATKTIPEDEQHIDEIPQEYSSQFSKALDSVLNSSGLLNPFIKNDLLKGLNINPKKYNREEIEQLLKSPHNNEQAIRSLSQYLENYVMHFKRLVFHYGTILTFDNYLEPTNADDEDMSTPQFSKGYKKAVDWLDKFNVKKSFSDILRKIILEDAGYYYIRQSDSGIVLQEMPSQYCKIVGKTDFGYQYSFNMAYFMQSYANIEDYPVEFKEYFARFTGSNEYKNSYPYWVELDPIKAPVFKFDENHAASIPPLMGIFIDTAEIATYKELLKTKTKLEVWKILLSKIPINQGDGKNNTKNNFAIDADTAAKFNAIIQAAIPEGTKSIVTPFETEAVDFKQSESRNDIAGIGEDMFYRSSGTSPILFGEKNTIGSGISATIRTDEAFVSHVYRVFERFINTQLKGSTGKYRFKIHFEGTIFDQEERFERALQAANAGAPKTYLAVAMGKTVDEFINLSRFENSINLVEMMKPLMSSHTQTDESGRPTKRQGKLGDAGQKTRDNDSNNNR